MKNNSRKDLLKLYDQFLKETKQGKRLQKNRTRLRTSSIEPYEWLRKLLYDFSIAKEFPLTVVEINKLRKKEIIAEEKY